ncbi:class D sortase [Pseudomaricurvus sp.]|uniref:class D sortase n=1 Tax=Pseudomaricurvus sp. TaxID=2004510 RepID=UPI003F6AC588
MRYFGFLKPAFLVTLERCLISIGLLGLLFVGIAYLDSAFASRQALAAFDEALMAQADSDSAAVSISTSSSGTNTTPSSSTPSSTSPPSKPNADELNVEDPDKSLWSESRKKKYAQAQSEDLPLAVLSIERLNLQVPVFSGTDRLTLNRGAGIVDGTAYPGEKGNMVVSAHRDGFFRPLKDIAVGDRITLQTLEGKQIYVVTEMFITDPLDISVLDPTDTETLTMITCYPFYFVGYAPERLIIRAQPKSSINPSLTVPDTARDVHPTPNTGVVKAHSYAMTNGY